MPVNYLARLTATERTATANLHLGVALAFVAGAVTAGGFLAIGQYTSHMTGIVSAAADNLVLGNMALAIAAALAFLSFVSGAATTALLVNYARRNLRRNIYSIPLLIEALLLLTFGMIGASLQLHEIISISATAVLLCYVMGLQNALVTKISNAEIRTTHLTGMVTDVGIELGKLFYWNRRKVHSSAQAVYANRKRLRVLLSLVGAFFLGAVTGALGFKHVGFASTIPLAMLLTVLSLAPAMRGEQL